MALLRSISGDPALPAIVVSVVAGDILLSFVPSAVALSLFAVPQADVSWGGKAITNLKDPVNPQDAATLAWVLLTLGAAVAGLVPSTRKVNGYPLSSDVNLTTADVPDSSDKRYVTDANRTVLSHTSGTNTGDQVLPVVPTTVREYFSGFNSSETLSKNPWGVEMVHFDGLLQSPATDYTLTGKVLTFPSPPGVAIHVVYWTEDV